MALPDYPSTAATYLGGLTNDDMINGGHRTHFIAALGALLELTGYTKGAAEALVSLAEQVADDAAAAAAGSGTEATVENIRSGLSAYYLSIRKVYDALAWVTLTDGPSVAVDMATGINFRLTLEGSGREIQNPTNQITGKSGLLVIRQDGEGGRVPSFGSNWKFAGGIKALSTAPNSIDVIAYTVESPGTILCTLTRGFA